MVSLSIHLEMAQSVLVGENSSQAVPSYLDHQTAAAAAACLPAWLSTGFGELPNQKLRSEGYYLFRDF